MGFPFSSAFDFARLLSFLFPEILPQLLAQPVRTREVKFISVSRSPRIKRNCGRDLNADGSVETLLGIVDIGSSIWAMIFFRIVILLSFVFKEFGRFLTGSGFGGDLSCIAGGAISAEKFRFS